ncbi:MAG TPA: hypothetical protein VFT13_11820 [Candidatus Krumholzibacteria bacterium]|nr:hypothetical protein [Candidatus Krumholzibacteria bacterium]
MRSPSCLVLASLIVIAAAGTLAPARAGDTTGVESHPWIGTAAPAFQLKSVGGGEVGLEGLEGKFVVIHFGASW